MLVSLALLVTLVFGVVKWMGHQVVKEYEVDRYTVRIIKEGRMLLGPKNYVLELVWPGSKARYPIFTALDFFSDAEPRDYQIKSLDLNPSKDLVTIVFSDGVTLKYPVFTGAFSRASFDERWREVYYRGSAK